MKQKIIKFIKSKDYYHDELIPETLLPQYKAGTYTITAVPSYDDKIAIDIKLLNDELFKLILTVQDDRSFIAEKNFNTYHYEKLKILGLNKSDPDINYFIMRLGGIAGLSSIDLKPKKNEFNDDRAYIALAIASIEFALKQQNPLILDPFNIPSSDWIWIPKILKRQENGKTFYQIEAQAEVDSYNNCYINNNEFFADSNGIVEIFKASKPFIASDFEDPHSKNYHSTLSQLSIDAAVRLVFNIINGPTSQFIEFLDTAEKNHKLNINSKNKKEEQQKKSSENVNQNKQENKARSQQNFTKIMQSPFFHKNINSDQAIKLLMGDFTAGSYLFYENYGKLVLAIKFFNHDTNPSTIFQLFIDVKEDGSLEILLRDNPKSFNIKWLGLGNEKNITDPNYFVNKLGGLSGVKFSDKSVEETGDRNINPVRLLFATLELDEKINEQRALLVRSTDQTILGGASLENQKNVFQGRTYKIIRMKDNKEFMVYGNVTGVDNIVLLEANNFLLPIIQHLIPKQGKQEQRVTEVKISDNNNEVKPNIPAVSQPQVQQNSDDIEIPRKTNLLFVNTFLFPEGTYTLEPINSNSLILSVLSMTRDIFQIALIFDETKCQYKVDTSKFDCEKNQNKLKRIGLLESRDLNYFIIRCGGLYKLEDISAESSLTAEDLKFDAKNLFALLVLTLEFFGKEENCNKILKLQTKDNLKLYFESKNVFGKEIYSYGQLLNNGEIWCVNEFNCDPATSMPIVLMDEETKTNFKETASTYLKILCETEIINLPAINTKFTNIVSEIKNSNAETFDDSSILCENSKINSNSRSSSSGPVNNAIQSSSANNNNNFFAENRSAMHRGSVNRQSPQNHEQTPDLSDSSSTIVSRDWN